jgi:hypothetical protein
MSTSRPALGKGGDVFVSKFLIAEAPSDSGNCLSREMK